MQVPSLQEFNELKEIVFSLRSELAQLKETHTVWIDQEEAMQLTGRSRGWFYLNRHNLPIAMLPRTEGSRRLKYSKADCIRYGRQHHILPPG